MQLIDGADNPGGLSSGWRNSAGQAVEAGIKGFWFQACSFSPCNVPEAIDKASIETSTRWTGAWP